ncbi:hypothetical protein VTN02DRAFT_2885 [Thermoascus thermophilus]
MAVEGSGSVCETDGCAAKGSGSKGDGHRTPVPEWRRRSNCQHRSSRADDSSVDEYSRETEHEVPRT